MLSMMDFDTGNGLLSFKDKICSFDLESDENGDIFAIAAIYQDQVFQRKGPFNIKQVLKEFDDFARDADFLLGHNIINHDMPLCYAITPGLAIHKKSLIDTLYLSPLAFPENPYHRLVKNYKLLRDSLNDPLADAKQAISLFEDQWQVLQQQHAESGLLSFYHYAFSDHSKYKGLQDILLAMG
ncbi:[weak similarity to] ATP-dependent DNA helicase, RecQ family/ UvrD/REP helicase domain protein, partial [methanotrophic bacterial endosymbiont of Bathymodiolus sp.]